jgi:hypothetical protein
MGESFFGSVFDATLAFRSEGFAPFLDADAMLSPLTGKWKSPRQPLTG